MSFLSVYEKPEERSSRFCDNQDLHPPDFTPWKTAPDGRSEARPCDFSRRFCARKQAVSMLSVYEKKIGIACALLIMVLAVHHCLGISVGEEQLRKSWPDTCEESSRDGLTHLRELSVN